MAGHSLETARQAYELWQQHGGATVKGAQRDAAEAMGVSKNSFQRMVAAHKRYSEADPAIRDSMAAVGSEMIPHMAWAKVPAKDGQPGYSVMLKPERGEDDQLSRIRAAFEGMETAPHIPPPTYSDDDLLTIYPIADAHIGMMAYGREVGEDYDTTIAVNRVRDWLGRCVSSSPASSQAVILDVGDLTHADDQTNQTPASGHVLDVDTRHFRTLEVTIETMGQAVQLALAKHDHVTVVVLPGNHSPHSFMAVLFAMAERYRDEPRVTIHKEPGEMWCMEFGLNMLAAHHGHKAPPQRLVNFVADEYAPQWGRTKHRYLWTGHLHHQKVSDIGGMVHEQLRAVTSRDAYAYTNAYTARAQLQGITLHRERGEIQRVKVGQ